MGFWDFFKTIGKSIVKGVRSAIKFVGKLAPTIRHIARGIGKAAKIVGRIPFLREPALIVEELAGLVEHGVGVAGDIAGELDAVDREVTEQIGRGR